MKTTLASITTSTQSSAAHREANPLHSGGLELISNVFRDVTAFHTGLQQVFHPGLHLEQTVTIKMRNSVV